MQDVYSAATRKIEKLGRDAALDWALANQDHPGSHIQEISFAILTEIFSSER
jgi:hypothetical protein